MSKQERLRLYLIRHGEVDGIAEGQSIGGRTDRPLSERGVAQAHNWRKCYSCARLSAVYSSDLQRANMTAEIIARSNRLKVRVDPAWREIDMGDWEWRTVSALHDEAPQLVERLFAEPDSFKYPEGESFADFTARVGSALDHVLRVTAERRLRCRSRRRLPNNHSNCVRDANEELAASHTGLWLFESSRLVWTLPDFAIA